MNTEKLKRYLVFLFGLFINSLGVSFITKASLGTSPISSIPYVLSLNFPLTLGQFTIIFNLLLIALQIMILRKNFKIEHLLQIPVTVLFGIFIDATMIMLAFLKPQTYFTSMIALLIGCVILGFGVYIEVLANVVMLPGESFVRAVTITWHTEFGNTKIIFDSSMTIIAGVMSLCFQHRLNGVREGTIIAALLVGFIARQFGRLLSFMPTLLFGSAASVENASGTSTSDDKTYLTIAIGRQVACNGHEIGMRLSEKLGYSFYDKDIIRKAADTVNYAEDYVQKTEEKMTNSLLYDLVNQMYGYSNEEKSPKDKIFTAEADAIQKIAETGNAVIIGRCSDAVLKDNPHCFRVWLYAPIESRAKEYAQKQHISYEDALSEIKKQDKQRAQNYHYYTNRIWGLAQNYNLCLDTSLGVDFVVDTIISTFEEWKK